MKIYYYIDSDNQPRGPYSPEELRGAGITPSTPVWRESMSDWAPAGSLEELAGIFARPEPYPQYARPATRPEVHYRSKPDSWLAWSILSTVLCCNPLGITAIIFAAKFDGLWAAGRYDEATQAARMARTLTIATIATALIFWFVRTMVVGLSILESSGDMY